MTSHSVTCHLTQVNTPCLNPGQTGRYLIYLPRRDGRLSWPRWLVTRQDGLPACRRSPIQVLTQQCMAGSRTVDHTSDTLTTRLPSPFSPWPNCSPCSINYRRVKQTRTYVLWIMYCSTCGEPMTSHAFSRLTASRQILLHMQQRALGRHRGRHLESVASDEKSSSVSWCVFTWRIIIPNLSWSDLKQWTLRLFWGVLPNKNNKMSSDMRSVTDPKMKLMVP